MEAITPSLHAIEKVLPFKSILSEALFISATTAAADVVSTAKAPPAEIPAMMYSFGRFSVPLLVNLQPLAIVNPPFRDQTLFSGIVNSLISVPDF